MLFFRKSCFLVGVLFTFFIQPAFGQLNRFENPANAQRNPQPNQKSRFSDKLRYGGFFTMQFGDLTFIELSPRVSYLLNDKSAVGLGGTYSYFNDRIFRFENSLYGGQVFYWRELFPGLVGHAEYELFNITPRNQMGFENPQREWVSGLLLGGALMQPMGNRGNVFFMVLYNVLWDPNRSLYNRPFIVRLGFAL
jgi:hypothetical protein